MFRPTEDEIDFIALFLEGFLYGLYTGIFAMYLQYHVSKQDTSKTQNLIFYSMCALYISSASVFVCDIALCVCQFQVVLPTNPNVWFPILIIQVTLFACCDFIAQFILIYRCWIIWGRNIRIVIIPSMLAFAFLVIWIVENTPKFGDLTGLYFIWLYPMSVAGLALSSTVNALVTGLIVFRILQVFRAVKAISDDKILAATGGSKLRSIILVLIESAMALFSIQLARLVVSLPGGGLYPVFSAIHEMLNGITPTIILVRISMGLSFHDEKSMEEVAIESLRFASHHPISVPKTGIAGQDIGDDDDIDIQGSNDIDVVER